MAKIYWNVSDERSGKLRYSNTAVGLHCLKSEKSVVFPLWIRVSPRARPDGLRPCGRAPADAGAYAPLRVHAVAHVRRFTPHTMCLSIRLILIDYRR